MTLHTLMSKAADFFSWLYYERAWSEWEGIAAVLVVIALLLLIARGRRRKSARVAKAAPAEAEKQWRGK
jgi:hypothetical protein